MRRPPAPRRPPQTLGSGGGGARGRVAGGAGAGGGSRQQRLAALGAEMLVAALAEIQAGRASAQAQPSEGVTYARKAEKAETVPDWARPAAELARAVRAFRPAPGATTTLEGEALKIWRARAVEGRGAAGGRAPPRGGGRAGRGGRGGGRGKGLAGELERLAENGAGTQPQRAALIDLTHGTLRRFGRVQAIARALSRRGRGEPPVAARLRGALSA